MNRSELRTPKTWRDWAIGLAIVAVAGGLLLTAYQLHVERGESECRAKCAAAGDKYSYMGPGRSSAEVCTCMKSR